MNILVTGGCGFIGSHLSESLMKKDHKVLAFDNLTTGRISNLPLGSSDNFMFGDTREFQDISNAFHDIKPDVVFHLAAQVDVRRSISEPEFDASVNIIGTLNVLKLCVEHKVSRLVFASSGGAIYREDSVFPKTESSDLGPTSPYGISKMVGEQYIEYFSRMNSLKTCVLRFSNVYGPRQVSHKCGVLGIFLENHARGRISTVFGDGNQTRDFIDVFSVVNALERAASLEGTFNVSSGQETSVNQIVDRLKQLGSFKCQYGDHIPGEMLRSCISSDKLRSTGWEPLMSLDSGIERTIEWFHTRTASDKFFFEKKNLSEA